jgi:hypothetical protein
VALGLGLVVIPRDVDSQNSATAYFQGSKDKTLKLNLIAGFGQSAQFVHHESGNSHHRRYLDVSVD